MGITRLVAFGVAGLTAATVTAPAWARTAQQEQELRRACSGDYSRLCSEFDPTSVQVAQCFQRNFSRVSQRCKDAISRNQ